jgi:glutaredoxin
MSILLLFLLFPFLPSAWGEIYQWTDKNGNVVFSDTPPPGKEAKIKQLKEEGVYTAPPREETAKPEIKNENRNAAPSQDQEREAKRKKRIRDVNVVMYSTNWCGYCKKAREYINSLGANLIEYNIEEDKSRGDEMLKKSGSRSIPVIDVEGIIIRGYSPGMIKQAVEQKANL